MRISWRQGNAPARVVLAAGLIAIPAVVLPGTVALAVPVAGGPHPAASVAPPAVSVKPPAVRASQPAASVTHPAVRVSQPVASVAPPAVRVRQPALPGLTVSVSDGRTAVQPGDQLTYLVSVRDAGVRGAPHLKITQTLSAGLRFLSASGAGVAMNRQVTWDASIPAGGTRTFSVVARVTRTPAPLLRLAAVACVAAMRDSSRPIVCAAHLDRLPAASAAQASRDAKPGGAVLLAYAAGALAVLAAGVLAVIAYRRSRLRRRPARPSRSGVRTRVESRHE